MFSFANIQAFLFNLPTFLGIGEVLAMEKESYCSQETFQTLKKKTFRNIPRSLLINVLEDLPDYASVVYLRLYDLAESNSRYVGTVIISHTTLGNKLKKSDSSIKRAIKILKEKGYIKVVQQGAKDKQYLPNIIHVLCPSYIANKILREEDRKSNILKFPETPKVDSNQEDTNSIEQPYKKALEEVLHEKENNSDENLRVPSVYQRYEKAINDLRNRGIKARMLDVEARKSLSHEENIELNKYIYFEAPKKTMAAFSASEKPNLNGELVKNDPHKINNRDQQFLMLTIDKAVDNNCIEAYLANLWTYTIVNFEKDDAVVNNPLSELENRMIESKLRAMFKCKEIDAHLETFGLRRLIAEVKYHVIHRDLNRTQTVKHALNAAAAMLRKGTWSTPKQLASLCANRMEQAAKYLKEKEIFDARNNPMKTGGLAFKKTN